MARPKSYKLSKIVNIYLIVTILFFTAGILAWSYHTALQAVEQQLFKSFNQSLSIAESMFVREGDLLTIALSEVKLNKNLLAELSSAPTQEANKTFRDYTDMRAVFRPDIFFITTLEKKVWLDSSSSILELQTLLPVIAKRAREFTAKPEIVRLKNNNMHITALLRSEYLTLEDGKVLGILVSGTILNDNAHFFNQIKERTKSSSTFLLSNFNNVIAYSSTQPDIRSTVENFLLKSTNVEIPKTGKIIHFNNTLLYLGHLLLDNSPTGLYIGITIDRKSAEDLQSSFIYKGGVLIAFMAVFIIISQILLRRLLIPAINNILNYTEVVSTGHIENIYTPGNVSEFNRIGKAMMKMVDSITEAHKDLKDKEENLSITLNSIGDGVISTDAEGMVTRMNPIAEKLTGWSIAEAFGKPMTEVFIILHAQTREPVENPIEKVLATGKTVGLANHTVLVAKDNSSYQIADSAAPIRSEQGNILGVVLVFRDVTEEHALQKQLQHSQRMDAIGQLAGGVAHDFNNMLGGIIGASELLQLRISNDSRAKELNNMVIKTSERAADLVRKLLAFARKQRVASSSIDVHRIINDSVNLLEHTIDKRINIKVQLEADEYSVIGDPSQLQSAIINLGINAADAMPDGGTIEINSKTIELDSAYCQASQFDLSPASYLEISIRDNGTGISDDELHKIFEPFFTTKEQGKGTGLGLAAVFGTIQQHQGAINVYSEPGKGTVFHILLPLVKSSECEQPNLNISPIRGSGKILIIDDEQIMRITAQAILEDLGYETVLASNGQEGIDLFKNNHNDYDLVLLDMVMPIMNGRDCFAKIQEIDPNARVILASGFSREEDVEKMKAQGLCDYISKPYRSITLSQAVHKALQSS